MPGCTRVEGGKGLGLRVRGGNSLSVPCLLPTCKQTALC